MLIYLAEIEAIDLSGANPLPLTLRVASAPSGYNHPTAPALYLPRIENVTNITRTIIAPRRSFGNADISTGTLELSNIDGELDGWFNYGYGRSARILLGEHDKPYSTFVSIITGIVDQPSGDKAKIIFRFQDRTKELERKVSPNIYAGNNSGLVGKEGTANDIKGANKIRIFGRVKNFAPDPININNNMFAVNHDEVGALAAIQSIDAVRVNGASWSNAGNVASISALAAISVTQGSFRTCITAGAFKMGGSWQGEITVDATESETQSLLQIANIASRILQSAGVSPSEINATALATSAPWQVGLVVRDDSSLDALNALLGQSAIWFAPDSNGVYHLRLIDPISNVTQPVATLKPFNYPNVAAIGDYQILDLEPELSSTSEVSIPAYRVVVNYDKREVVQNEDAIAASVNATNKQYYSRQYAKVVLEDLSILQNYPDSPALEFATMLRLESDAISLCNRLFAIYSKPRQLYKIKAKLTPDSANNIQLGDVVKLVYPRFGLSEGKLGRVISEQYDAKRSIVEMEVWT